MEGISPLQMWVWGWPGQHSWQLTATAGKRNATNTYSGGKDIFPLFTLTVIHYSPKLSLHAHCSCLEQHHEIRGGCSDCLGWETLLSKLRFSSSLSICCSVSCPSTARQLWSGSVRVRASHYTSLVVLVITGILIGILNFGCSKYCRWIHLLFNYFLWTKF